MQINDKYKDFFYEARRATSKVGKKVAVVDEEKFPQFLQTLAIDSDIPLNLRVCFGLLFSGGMRISECLSIKKKDITRDADGTLIIVIKVLKKKKLLYKLTRDVVVHPAIAPILDEYIFNKRPNDRIFVERSVKERGGEILTRFRAIYYIKKYLGNSLDLHSLRHSNVSALLDTYNTIQISKILMMSEPMVANYGHCNVKKKMKDLYQKK